MRLFNLNLYQTVTTKNSWFHLTQSHYQMTEYNSIAYFQITKHSSISLFSNERTQETLINSFFYKKQQDCRLLIFSFLYKKHKTLINSFLYKKHKKPHMALSRSKINFFFLLQCWAAKQQG